jgi:polysaccharide biosynthesis transport protein
MALSAITPRDRLQRLVDLGRKTLRYWWLIALFAIAGGGLSLAFALLKARSYQSAATLFYQERIQSNVLAPNREEVAQRNLGDKYRELLLAREQLQPILADDNLNPFPHEAEPERALEKLREQIKLEVKGGGVFRIVYGDADPDRAKAVTEKLTKQLQDKDEAMRREMARLTVEFATKQKDESATELRKREQALNEFLAKHPEFVQEANATSGEGAAFRAVRNQTKNTGDKELYALERQRQRLQARLDAPPDAAIKISAPPTAEKVAAEAAVKEAEREVGGARRELADAKAKFTDVHPSVINAQKKLDGALQTLRRAQADVPADIEVAPATPQDREKLRKELAQIEQQIANRQQKGVKLAPDATTSWVVQLENDHAELRRLVNEQRERVNSLAESVFRAQMDASQKAAEQGRLQVVNPAERPVRPSGPGKTIFLMAGMVLFLSLGLALAVGLAVIDDRLYRRSDIDHLNLAVLAVIPHARARHVKRRKGHA